ncbi:unnamed protein product [Mycena citricolor]|uniref:DSBA-like thioredoxin domain-containing protein n=1 Tax=Mycena citricolor TaxID=2018698 RepID=A0AAD2Q1L6_9AGAR|nr:unnamed protein product [Mycena citricolor]
MPYHIDCYLDCASSCFSIYARSGHSLPHTVSRSSAYASGHLVPREHKTHQLISFHPVLLGGVHRASGAWAAAAYGGVSASVVVLVRYLGGNEPPRTLPAKAAYLELDIARTARYHGVSGVAQPAFFPVSTVMAQRILCYVKATLPQPAFEQTLLSFFRSLWVLPHADISKPDVVRGVLDELHLYSEAQIDAILAAPAQKE